MGKVVHVCSLLFIFPNSKTRDFTGSSYLQLFLQIILLCPFQFEGVIDVCTTTVAEFVYLFIKIAKKGSAKRSYACGVQ